MPTCWIIAGPNGAGKTTFALRYLPEVAGCRRFINADLIAAGLSPLAPERELAAASRLFLHELEAAIKAGEDFAFETTLAGRTYLKPPTLSNTPNRDPITYSIHADWGKLGRLRMGEVRHQWGNLFRHSITRSPPPAAFAPAAGPTPIAAAPP
jgi:hypothetical protein